MQTANQPALSRRTIRMRIMVTLIYAALVPYLIYRVGAERYHLSAVNALLLAALSPAVGSLIEFVRISDSLLTGVYGLILLGSVLIGKPVTVVLATNMYATSPEQRAQVQQRLQASGAHRQVLILTAMWGIGLLLLLAISVLLTYTFPIATVVLIRP